MARRRPRADDRPGRHRPSSASVDLDGLSRMSVEILTFGCRLNAYESEVMRGHAAGAGRHHHRQHLRRHRRGRAPGAPGDPPRRAANAPRRASSSPAAPRRSTRTPGRRCPAWTACSATQEKLRPESWAPDAPVAVSDIMAARETAAHLVTEFAGRARAFVQVQQGCDHRCTFCIIPFGRGPIAQRADRRGRGAGARAGRGRLPRGGADRRRYRLYGADLPGAPTPRPAGAPAAGAGAGAAAAAAVLARSGGDRRRSVAADRARSRG